MRHAGVTDEQVQIALPHRHPTRVNNISQAQKPEHVKPMLRTFGHQGKGNSNEAIETELFEHTSVEHGRSRRRGAVSEGSPGMKGPECNEDAEAEHQEREYPALSVNRHRLGLKELNDFRYVERPRVRRHLQIKGDQADQSDE